MGAPITDGNEARYRWLGEKSKDEGKDWYSKDIEKINIRSESARSLRAKRIEYGEGPKPWPLLGGSKGEIRRTPQAS